MFELPEILESHEIPDENPEETQNEYIKRKRREFLDEMVAHFSNNPRGINEYGGCVYSHDFNGGCAIGRKISADLAIKFDENFGGNVNQIEIFSLLPPRIKYFRR